MSLELERPALNLGHTSHGSQCKFMEEVGIPRFACLPWQVHSLLCWYTAYFFRNSRAHEGQLRLPALEIEQLLDSWIYCREPAVVGRAGPQPVNHPNTFPFSTCIFILLVLLLQRIQTNAGTPSLKHAFDLHLLTASLPSAQQRVSRAWNRCS